MAKYPEPAPESQPDAADTDAATTDAAPDAFVPNRRERRGGKPPAVSQRGGKPAVRGQSTVPSRRQYSTRRRGGG